MRKREPTPRTIDKAEVDNLALLIPLSVLISERGQRPARL